MSTSEWFSATALLISIGSLWISRRNFIRDRYRLRFEGFVLILSGADGETFKIAVKTTNAGRRPISIIEVYYRHSPREERYGIQTPIHGGLADAVKPFALSENETHTFASKEIPNSKMLKLPPVIDVCVEDSTGKHYHIPVPNEAL